MLWRLGQLDEAVSSYDKALQLCPNHLRALLCRGLVLLRLSRPAEALESLARLLAEAPDNADALVACAAALQSLNRENKWIDSLQHALAAQPNHPRALTALGTKLLDRGEAAQAIAHFDRVLLVAPRWGAVHARRGHALHALGRTAEALEALCTATAMEPANAEAWSFLDSCGCHSTRRKPHSIVATGRWRCGRTCPMLCTDGRSPCRT